MPAPKLFVSYRRTKRDAVTTAVTALRHAGVDCFFDLEEIDALADFPDRIREGLDSSHALLAWWSLDYAESEFCLAELRRGWQHARRHSSDVGRRVWILNPEADGNHVFAGELNARNFLTPPADLSAWAAGIRQTLDALLPEGTLADERRAPVVPPRRNVPRASAEFVGRGAAMFRIHSKLFPPRLDSSSRTPGVQLHAMGGLGKTELAAKYAESFAAAYPRGVFWLNLASFTPAAQVDENEAAQAWLRAVESMFADEPDLQRMLLRDADGKALPARAARAAIGRWLWDTANGTGAGRDPYLWIVDNVPPMSPLDARDRVLEFWRAPNDEGRTLITTRDRRSASGFVEEPLDVLDEVSAMSLLGRYEAIADADRPYAKALIHEVGGHTLALMLLAEQLREGDGYAAAVTRLHQAGRLERLEQIAALLRSELGDRARSVVATFELSITPLPADAKTLLGLAAACAPAEPIPRALLCDAFGDSTRADACTRAVQAVLRASLVTRRRGHDAVEIHPLVAEAATRLLDVRFDREGEALIRVLATVLPDAVDVRVHPRIAPYVVHARHLVDCAPLTASLARLSRWVARFDHERGASVPAEKLLRQVIAFYSDSTGPEDEQTLLALGDLGRSLLDQHRLDEAIEVDIRVVKGRRKLLGREHIDTLTAMNNLAAVLATAGKTRQALALHRKLLAVRRRTLGEKHDHTLYSLSNYGADLLILGRVEEARGYLAEAYRLRKEIHGADHENTNVSATHLAHALIDLQDFSGAIALLQEVASARRRILGESHRRTISSEVSLGRVMIAQGDMHGAQRLLEGTLANALNTFGPDHTETLLAMNNLGKALLEQGELDAALRLLTQATERETRRTNPTAPLTVRFALNLFDLLERRGSRDDAAGVFERHLKWLTTAVPAQLDGSEQESLNRLTKILERSAIP